MDGVKGEICGKCGSIVEEFQLHPLDFRRQTSFNLTKHALGGNSRNGPLSISKIVRGEGDPE